MDIGSILLGVALLVVIAFIVARPLLEPTGLGDLTADPADQLLAHREQVLTQLRDLDFDAATGKFNDADYASQRAQLIAEGVGILKQLDALRVNAEQPAADVALPIDEIEAAVAQLRARRAVAERSAPAPNSLDAQIEASVAQRRAAGAAKHAPAPTMAVEKRVCVQCRAEALPGDRFCAKCGAPLPAPAGGLRQPKVQG